MAFHSRRKFVHEQPSTVLVLSYVLRQGDLDFSTHPWPMISQEAKDCVSRMLVQVRWSAPFKSATSCLLFYDASIALFCRSLFPTHAPLPFATLQSPRRRILASELLVHPWMRENGVASDKPLDDAIITRLGTFATHNKLKREAMRVIAAGMPAEEIAGLQSIFEVGEGVRGDGCVERLSCPRQS